MNCSAIHRLRCFTLVELLVVVAIIAMLAALLLPSLKRAKDASKQVVCLVHIKQLGTGLLVMSDENNGWFEPSRHNPPTNDWRYAVIPYLAGKSELSLPGYNPERYRKSCPTLDPGSWGYTAYGISGMFVIWKTSPVTNAYHSTVEVIHPSTTFLVADCYWPFNENIGTLASVVRVGNGADSSPRHEGRGINFFFIDGHGEFLQYRPKNATDQYGKASDWWPSSTLGLNQGGGPCPYNIIGFPY